MTPDAKSWKYRQLPEAGHLGMTFFTSDWCMLHGDFIDPRLRGSYTRTSGSRPLHVHSPVSLQTRRLLLGHDTRTDSLEPEQIHLVGHRGMAGTLVTGQAELERSLGPMRYVHGTSDRRGC